jgi:hypothetical protein
LTRATVRFLWRASGVVDGFRTGVSLHSHTMHSREVLAFVPRYARMVPLLSWEFERQKRRYEASHGKPPDFSTAYWTPPLPSWEAFEVERRQIEDVLGLSALVSLTDHDNIDAGCQLQMLERQIPISVEWTIPFDETFFHLGLHNLPVQAARDLIAALANYTRRPDAALLQDLLAALDAESGVLIVLNHPMWDQAAIGLARHRVALWNLIETVGDRIHALELNGLRPWRENRIVVDLARDLDRTLVSGGDRHGREPNALINLTNAATFTEFVDEVRSGGSHVLFLPQYREPLGLRILQTICEILRDRPDLEGREKWTDRVFYVPPDGELKPLSSAWKGGGPAVARWFVRGVELAGSRRVQRALRLWLMENHDFALTVNRPAHSRATQACGRR